MNKKYITLLGLVFISGCTQRPPLDRNSFRNDGTSIRSDSQVTSPVESVPENQRLKNPELILAAIRGGDAQVANGEYLAGAELYKRAYDGNPEVSTLVLMSRAMRLGGEAQKSVLTLQSLEKVHGNSQAFLVELARASIAGGYNNDARVALEKAIARPDAGWAAYITMGALQAKTGKSSEAKASFNEAQRRSSTQGEKDASLANLAMLEAQDGRIDVAISMLEPLASKPSAHRKTMATLAVLYGIKGDRTKYLDIARKSGMTGTEIEMGSRWLDISNSDEIDVKPTVRRSTANHRN